LAWETARPRDRVVGVGISSVGSDALPSRGTGHCMGRGARWDGCGSRDRSSLAKPTPRSFGTEPLVLPSVVGWKSVL
jgi:hypothetical protein